MKVLITGAQGFVGRYLCAHLQRHGATQIMGLGRSPRNDTHFTHAVRLGDAPVAAPLPPDLQPPNDTRWAYHPCDVRDQGELVGVLNRFQPDALIHLATGLRDDPADKLVGVNIQGVITLLESINAANAKPARIVLGSSGGVYGIPATLPIPEHSHPQPRDLYSVTKLSGELAAEVLAARYQLPVIHARIFNIVGPGEDERHACGRWAAELTRGKAGGAPFTLEVGTLTTTRDFIDVRDVAAGLTLLAQNGEPGRAYNLASGRETQMQTVLDQLIRITQAQVQVVQAFSRPSDIPRHFADITRLSKLGFQPRYSLETSLADVAAYYHQHTP